MHCYIWQWTAQWLFYNYTMIENYTFLRNESQFLKFLYFRQVVRFGKMSFRRKVRSSYCPFDKMSVRLSVRRQNVRSAKCLSAKCLSAKCPGYRRTIYCTALHCIVQQCIALYRIEQQSTAQHCICIVQH